MNNEINDYMSDSENLLSPLLCYDYAFRKVFDGLDNVLLKMFTDITGTSLDVLRDNIIILNKEEEVDARNIRGRIKDFVLRILDAHIIFLEFNKEAATGKLLDGFSNMVNLRGEWGLDNVCSSKKEIMILDFNIYKDKAYDDTLPLEVRRMVEGGNNKLYLKNTLNYQISVPKCYEEYCNRTDDNIEKYIYWGALLYCEDIEEISNILDKIVSVEEKEIILERFKKLDRNDLYLNEAEKYNILSKRRIDYGFECFKKQWKENREKEEDNNEENDDIILNKHELDDWIETIVMNLFLRNMAIADISDVVGISEEEINSIIEKE